MKPFVLLASRAEDDAADDEYEAFCRHGGLAPHQLRRVRMEQGPLPAIDLDEVSGVLVGGSPFTASDDDKSATQVRVERQMGALLDEAVARDVPFLGACYGVGTLGVHQGGAVDGTYGEPVGPVTITLTDAGRDDPLLADLPTEFAAFVGHKEACTTLPAGAVLLASSPTCPVQMFRVREHLYATQFHPELDLPGIEQRIATYAGYGYFADDEVDAVLAGVRAADVWAPPRILAAFVERFARA